MNVVILGCGRMGSKTALMMDSQGHKVTVIDKDRSAAKRLGTDFNGDFIIGSGLESETLERAGLDKADAFVSTTNYDNRNIMSAMMARELFSVPTVIARFYDADRAEIFHKMGIKAICVTTLGSGIAHDIILGTKFKTVLEYSVED